MSTQMSSGLRIIKQRRLTNERFAFTCFMILLFTLFDQFFETLRTESNDESSINNYSTLGCYHYDQ